MSESPYYGVVLSVGMLATGTLNTLLTKLQDKQCIGNCADPDPLKHEHFEQPVWQTLNMFYGEMLCLACFYLYSLYQRRRETSPRRDGYEAISETDESDDSVNAHIAEDIPTTDALPTVVLTESDAPRQPKPIAGYATLWMWVPAVCDLLGTTLMNVGLFFTTASVYQMLRGAVVVFSGLFSVLFLGHRLARFQIIALLLVVVGVTIVGLSNIISPPAQLKSLRRHAPQSTANFGEHADEINSDAWKAVLGVVLVLGAQVFTATQFVVEEKIIRHYHLTPLRAVGLEGSFGALTVMAAIPVLHLTIGRTHPGGYFDAPEGFRQIVQNPAVWQTSIYIMLSIAMFNFFGLSVTRYLSATSRATIDTCRTLFIWMSSIALGWETFSWIQVIGFVVLVYGTFIYNRVIASPF
ncbi:hypothetical protein GGI13_004371 [Coemansia sp. RSA 455]|nr:hypothetical protein LPJ71_006019 [Coemansia sp. S17]KAJ2019548.1 hypothetical protein GGI14_001513 [Coemansia sp. S680]KAJ2094866.1 hypothetical protein GGI09_005171 [Coemansia sp. S100]KAJ2249183.1 hypothetical protein GGI13_004371 [Coemansia sp. RSA 455]KAJ2469728.1 hypothetical protein GGI03_000176 [Coemansia sp. RSA 2337]